MTPASHFLEGKSREPGFESRRPHHPQHVHKFISTRFLENLLSLGSFPLNQSKNPRMIEVGPRIQNSRPRQTREEEGIQLNERNRCRHQLQALDIIPYETE